MVMIREQTNNGFKANPGLINKQAAYAAHAGTSFEPEKRGEQAIRAFAEEVQAVYERLKPHARTDTEKALLITEMERFQASYAQKYNDLLYSHSRIYSTMIAGPSGFPTERMRKINEAYDKRAHETYEWKDRAEKAMLRALKGLATEEAGGEVAVLKNKIAQAEKLQEMMVEANKIVRKKAEPGIGGVSKQQQLINMGFTERQAMEALKPDYMGRIGFPAFALSNNSANIRRMKERVIELGKREVTPTAEIPFTGGSIVDNREEDRVQIFFDQKPPQAMIDKLKSEGWRWAPSVGAWSRKRTENALYSARRITGAAAPTVQQPVKSVPPKLPPLLYPAPPQRPAEEIMVVPNPETMTRDEYVKEKYKRMAQVLRQQGKNAIAERVEKGARDPERTFKYETSHRDQVVQALAQNKAVSPEVLKDYPDIVARIRKENEEILAKIKAEREQIKATERAEENELNAELNRLPPALKRHAETEIYGTLHLPETHKDYRNRYYIALGKVRRIAFTHLPGGKEPQPEVRKEEPVEPLSPEQERIIKAYLEKRGHELTLRDFVWADKYTIRGTAKYPIRTMEEKPRVLGAPTPQERFEEEQRKKAVSAFRGQQKLTSGASVTKRLSEFGIKERMLPEMTSSMREYIRGAVPVRDVIHYFRDGSPPMRGVAYRARDRTYFVEANDGQIYDSMGWEEVGAQPQGVRESYTQRQRFTIKQDGRVFANEDDPTEAENIYKMLKRTYPRSAIDLLENLVHPRVHQRVLKEYNPMSGETVVAGAGMVREPVGYARGHGLARVVPVLIPSEYKGARRYG